MATRSIRQTALVRGATPGDIYATLMDGKRHGALSGQATKVSSRVGGKWSVGHDLEGKNLRLVKDRRIVQTWRANNWPKTNQSKVTFELTRTAAGTRIKLTQTGVPSQFYREINTGWRTYYWAPLRRTFAKAR